MAHKTPLDQMADAISDILEEYGDDLTENVGEIVTQLGRKGAQALKKESRQAFPKGTGEYARHWRSQVERGRLSTTAIIYNDHPGLPHLLEHGHVARNGTGRIYGEVRGREHIEPVADKLVETFEREVVSKL